MARTITELTAATTPLAGTELAWIEQGGLPRKVAVSDIADAGTLLPASTGASNVLRGDGAGGWVEETSFTIAADGSASGVGGGTIPVIGTLTQADNYLYLNRDNAGNPVMHVAQVGAGPIAQFGKVPSLGSTGYTAPVTITNAGGLEVYDDIDLSNFLGDRITLWGTHDDAASYALGIESNTMYFKSDGFYRWYFGQNADAGSGDVMELDEFGELWITPVGSRIQTGPNAAGTSQTIGATQHTDSTALSYRAYWAYDCYWDDTNDEWVANRTTLGRKFAIDMGYHNNNMRLRTFDGTVSSPWADSAWTNMVTISSAQTAITGDTAGTHALLVTNAGTTNAIAKFLGDSDGLEINTVSTGDYTIRNTAQNNYITFYDGTGGVDIGYNGQVKIECDSGNNVGLYAGATSVLEFQTQDSNAVGNTTGALVKNFNGSFYDVGMNNMPRFVSNANVTLTDAHCGGYYYSNNATTYTITLNNASGGGLDFPIGGLFFILNYGNSGTSGNITVNTGTGTLYTPGVGSTTGSRTVGPGVATILKYAADTWFIWGDSIT
jgi:hypothetical protein